MASIANVPGLSKLSPGDLQALVGVANAIEIDPDWLATVMSFESGFSPSIRNGAGSGATGLIQFMPSTAAGLGTTTDALAAMSFQDQLEYVRRYFAPHAGKLHSLEDTYLAVFYPAFIGAADDAVLGSEGSAIYDQNSGFDAGHKGYVTKSDITTRIRAQLAKADGRVDVPGVDATSAASSPASGSGPWTKLGEILVVFAVLGGASWALLTYTEAGRRLRPQLVARERALVRRAITWERKSVAAARRAIA